MGSAKSLKSILLSLNQDSPITYDGALERSHHCSHWKNEWPKNRLEEKANVTKSFYAWGKRSIKQRHLSFTYTTNMAMNCRSWAFNVLIYQGCPEIILIHPQKNCTCIFSYPSHHIWTDVQQLRQWVLCMWRTLSCSENKTTSWARHKNWFFTQRQMGIGFL